MTVGIVLILIAVFAVAALRFVLAAKFVREAHAEGKKWWQPTEAQRRRKRL